MNNISDTVRSNVAVVLLVYVSVGEIARVLAFGAAASNVNLAGIAEFSVWMTDGWWHCQAL